MFSTPTSPVFKPLLSEEEADQLHGKIKCFNKLIQHPRITIKELQEPIDALNRYLHYVFHFRNTPYNEALRKQVLLGWKMVTQLEDIVIRVVVRGESVEEVRASQKNRCI